VGGASYFYSTLTALDLSIRDITSNGQIYTSNNVASTGSTSGALRVTGGAGVQGNLYVGGTVNAISTSTNSTVFAVSGTQASTSSITGSATFAGGIGVGANSYFGANMTIAGTTDSSSSTVGALTVAGGLGVSKNIYVGGNAAITGTLTSNTGLNVYGGNGLLAASNVSTQRSGTSVTTAGMIVQTGLVCQTNAVLPRGWIALGAPLPLSSSTYKFGSKSLDLTGTAGTLGGSYISLPNFWPSMNTGNWTLEFWLYHTCTATSSFPNIVSTGLSAIMVQARDTNLLISLASAGSYNIANAVASPALTANAWNHVALIFDGSAYYCYVHNGTSSSRTTIATSSLTLNIITSTVTYGYWAIGTSNNGKGQIGYIDDFRLSNTVRYSTASSSHTPPASQLSWDSSTVTLNNFEAADCVSGAQCNFGLVVGSGLPATSSTSAALAVTGGAGVTGDVYVGGSMNLTTPLGVASGGLGLNTSATASGAIPYTSATGTWSTLAKGTDGYVLTLVSGLPAWQAASSGTNMASLYVSGNVDATSASTGSITTAGGIGVAKSVYVGNQLTVGGASYFFASTASTSSTTGAITVTGGIGVAGNSYFGGTLNVLSNALISGNTIISGSAVFQGNTGVSSTSTNSTVFSVSGSLDATSASTGSMTTLGGFGVAKSVYVGGSVTATTGLSLLGGDTVGTSTLSWLVANQGASMSISTNRLRFGAVTNATSANATSLSFPNLLQSSLLGSINTAFTLEFYFRCDNISSVLNGVLIGNLGSNGLRIETTNRTSGSAASIFCSLGTGSNFNVANATALTTTYPAGNVISVVFQYNPDVQWTVYYAGTRVIANASVSGLRLPQNFFTGLMFHQDGPLVAGFGNGDGDMSITAVRLSTGILYSESGNITPATAPYSSTTGTVLLNNFGTTAQSTVQANVVASETVFTPTSKVVTSAVGNEVYISSNLPSSSSVTGALNVAGGVGVCGDVVAGGNVYANLVATSATSGLALAVVSTTDSSSTVTGAVTVSGGLGVGKSVQVGTTLTTGGAISSGGTIALNSNMLYLKGVDANHYIQWVSTGSGGMDGPDVHGNLGGRLMSSTAGTVLTWSNAGVTVAGAMSVSGTSSLATVTGTTGYFSSTTASSSTTTGSVTVAGGLGVVGNTYVGGNVQLPTGQLVMSQTSGINIALSGGISSIQNTAATSSGTGSVQLAGGIGVGAASYYYSNVTTASRNFFYENGNWVVNTPAQVSFTGTGSTTFSSTGYFQVPSLGSLFTTSSAFTIEFTFSYASGTGGTILLDAYLPRPPHPPDPHLIDAAHELALVPLLVPALLVGGDDLLRPVAGVDRQPVRVLVPVVVVHAEEVEHVLQPAEHEAAHVAGITEVPAPRYQIEVVRRGARLLEPDVAVHAVIADDLHLVAGHVLEEPRLIAFATLAH
jgi:hypothetical protein